MSLRNDQTSGLLTHVLGIIISTFGTFGLVIVVLQHVFFLKQPVGPTASGQAIELRMRAIDELLLIYLPIMVLGGVLFSVFGYYVRHGSQWARRLAQIVAVCGFAWVIAYFIHGRQIPSLPERQGSAPLESLKFIVDGATRIGSYLLLAAVPSFIFFVLSRPRNRTLVSPGANMQKPSGSEDELRPTALH